MNYRPSTGQLASNATNLANWAESDVINEVFIFNGRQQLLATSVWSNNNNTMDLCIHLCCYSCCCYATSSQTVQTRGAFCAAISITQWTRERDFIMMRWSLNRAPSPFIAEEGLKNSMGVPHRCCCCCIMYTDAVNVKSTNPLFFHAQPKVHST